MTPERFRMIKHLTAALFALAMTGLFVAGTDGLITGVQRLTRIYVPSRPEPAAPPAEAPPAATGTAPGVIAAFVVPPEPAGAPTAAGSASGSSGR